MVPGLKAYIFHDYMKNINLKTRQSMSKQSFFTGKCADYDCFANFGSLKHGKI